MASEMLMIHYNDVYTIEPGSDKSAGAARFASKLKSFKEEDPLILFSGDAFNPSAMSTVTKGKHMVPVLNDLGTHVACMGNHGESPELLPSNNQSYLVISNNSFTSLKQILTLVLTTTLSLLSKQHFHGSSPTSLTRFQVSLTQDLQERTRWTSRAENSAL